MKEKELLKKELLSFENKIKKNQKEVMFVPKGTQSLPNYSAHYIPKKKKTLLQKEEESVIKEIIEASLKEDNILKRSKLKGSEIREYLKPVLEQLKEKDIEIEIHFFFNSSYMHYALYLGAYKEKRYIEKLLNKGEQV